MRHRLGYTHAGLALLWGVSYLLVAWMVPGFGWAGTASLICVVMALSIALPTLLSGKRLNLRIGWRRMLILGAAVAIQHIGLALAVEHLGTSLAAIALGAIPLFATLIGQMWGMERITGVAALGLVLGFLGMLLVVAFPAVGIRLELIAGLLAGLFSALAAAFATRYTTRRLGWEGPRDVAVGSFLIAGVLTLPLVWIFPPPGIPTTLPWAALGAFAVLIGGFGYLFYSRLVDDGEASRAAGARSLAMIVAVLIGTIFLGEVISAMEVFGVLMVFTGGVLVLGLMPRVLPARLRR